LKQTEFPLTVIRPIDQLQLVTGTRGQLLYHSAPSFPLVMLTGPLTAPAKVTTFPAVVIRPMLGPPKLVNHTAPSGPLAMAHGFLMPGSR